MKDILNVNEIFLSIQGEGPSSGTPSIFIRLSGCNLKCWYCDSKYSNSVNKGKEISFQNIKNKINEIEKKNNFRIVITGGEPLLQKNNLYEFFKTIRYHNIAIETNATIILPKLLLNNWICFNASPKLSSCGVSKDDFYKPEVIKQLNSIEGTIFKFVISNENDLLEALELYINKFNISKHKIWLMPLGNTNRGLNRKASTVIELCKKYNFNFSPRLQITYEIE